MEQLFAALFALYLAFAVLSAVLRKVRNGQGPSLPPVVDPDLFPWPLGDEEEEEADAAEPPGVPVTVQEGVDSKADAEPASRLPTRDVEAAPTSEPPVGEEEDSPASRAAEPEAEPAEEPVSLLADLSRSTSRTPPQPEAAHRRQVALTPQALREALIVSELFGPPRAVRPYNPFPWRRSGL